MTSKNNKRISKFLSLLLRHKPETIGLHLDEQGWADIDELIAKANANGNPLSREIITDIVASNDKQRFILSEDENRIRANQGHSINVNLGLSPITPPDILWHGTATRFLEPILAEGLKKMNRQHVHLSADLETASKVGIRHGKLAMLRVDASGMHADGYSFYRSENGVWLTDHVPPTYISQH